MGEYIKCDNCGKSTDGEGRICSHCNEPMSPQLKQQNREREELKTTLAISNNDWANVPLEVVQEKASHVILTTSYLVSGREIECDIEVLTAECVFGMNIFKDFLAGVRDLVGGRSAATQKVLSDARVTALTELKREALIVGGDAVIGIDLDYQELSGGQKNGMLMIVASGTAVRLKNPDIE